MTCSSSFTDSSLTQQEALPLLLEWNQSCQPPWTEDELLRKLEEAERAPGARGLLIGDEKAAKKKRGRPSARASGSPGSSGSSDGTTNPDSPDDPLAGEKEDAASLDPVPTARDFILVKCSYSPPPIPDPADPNKEEPPPIPRLIFWRGEFLSWSESTCKYSRISNDFVKAILTRYLDGFADQITTAAISNILNGIKSICIQRDEIEPPSWILGNHSHAAHSPCSLPPLELLSTRSGIIHLPSFAAGGPSSSPLIPITPKLFTENSLEFNFVPDAPPPSLWLTFLNSLWPDDPASLSTLQEWFGYCLLPDTSQQKILMMIGPTRSGKGTIARIIRQLIGEKNIGAPTLASLSTNFGLQPLLGKSLAIISDARLSGRTDSAAVAERLLSISGEDAQTIDRKNLPSVTTKLSTRFMVLTNELPKLGDSSGALTGRLIILKFTESFYGREDTTLTAKLIPELPGILLWAIAGWKRLHDRGSFSQPESGEELAEVMGELSSPISTFIRDCCIDSANATCPKADLFTVWKAWCEIYGRDHPGDHATFGRNLRAARSKIRNAQPRVPGQTAATGRRIESYAGIGLSEAARSAMTVYKSSEESGQQLRLTSILKQWIESGSGAATDHSDPLPPKMDEKTQDRIMDAFENDNF